MKRFLIFISVIMICLMTGCAASNDESSENSLTENAEEEIKTDEANNDKNSVSDEIKVKPHTDSSDLTAEQLKGGYENLLKFYESFEKDKDKLIKIGFEEKFNEMGNILNSYEDVDFAELNDEEFEAAYQELNGVAIQFDEFRAGLSKGEE